MTTLFGIDIGTTTICGVAISDRGERRATVQRPNDSTVSGRPEGHAEQNPLRIQARTFEVIRELCSLAGAPDVIGFTGQMHGMLCVDAAGQPLSNLVTWQDSRGLEKAPAGGTYIDAVRAALTPEQWSVCGCLPASGFLGSTLYWLQQHQAIPTGTSRVCFVHDWLAASFTGEAPVTDPGDAGSAGIYDLQKMQWHADGIASLGLPGSLLPEVRESGEVIGRVNAETARQTGLPTGTPVCNAIGDNQASVIGSVADLDASILLNLGTGGQISWAIPTFARTPGMETRYLPRQRFMLVGASLCGGRAYAWLNDTVREWTGHLGVAVDRAQVYDTLNALAARASLDCAGLTATTTFAGTRAEPDLRGAFKGVSLTNFTLGNVARAVLTGMIDELAAWYVRATAAGGSHEYVVAAGNAVRANPVLPKLIQERFGKPVRVPAHQEEAAFGACLVAGVGGGIWADPALASRCIRYQQ